jgi:5-hydroxyisourate hydrolase
MSGISTHVLDTSLGQPAAGVPVSLERRGTDGSWLPLSRGTTDAEGRLGDLLPPGEPLSAATYRMVFDTAAYFRGRGAGGFFPEVSVVFTVTDPGRNHHVPLLLSPYGYSTYRGS